ncbi:hypothetical protein D3C77_195870 [compost metagenome]
MIECKDFLEPAITLTATFLGAWLAFRFERKNKKDDEEQRQCGAANQALCTLFFLWSTTEQYRKEAIEPCRGKSDAWLNMPAQTSINFGLASFEAGALSFLLQTSTPMIYPELFLEEQRFAELIKKIEWHFTILMNDVYPRFAAAGVNVGASLAQVEIEQIIGNDTAHKLREITKSLESSVDENLRTIVSTHDRLYAAMIQIYPKRKFVKADFHIRTS